MAGRPVRRGREETGRIAVSTFDGGHWSALPPGTYGTACADLRRVLSGLTSGRRAHAGCAEARRGGVLGRAAVRWGRARPRAGTAWCYRRNAPAAAGCADRAAAVRAATLGRVSGPGRSRLNA